VHKRHATNDAISSFAQPDTQESVFVPVAIKLQPHDDEAPIFTSNCYEYDWLIAKVTKARRSEPVQHYNHVPFGQNCMSL
jgi:hypothetical protein